MEKTYENNDFLNFFTPGPVVLPNAASDVRDTTHLGEAPDAQYTRPGQGGLRRTVQKIRNCLQNFIYPCTPFVLTFVTQNDPSW
jgi:hypothetical protein